MAEEEVDPQVREEQDLERKNAELYKKLDKSLDRIFQLEQQNLRQPTEFRKLALAPQPQRHLSDAMKAKYCRDALVENHKLFKFLGGIRVSDYQPHPERFVFEINTMADGQWNKLYYVTANRTEDGFTIGPYRLPHVMIMERTLKEYPLEDDEELTMFLRRIQQSCDAFHVRQAQVQELKAMNDSRVTKVCPDSVLSYLNIKIMFSLMEELVLVELDVRYELHHVLPYGCDVIIEDKLLQKRLEDNFEPFRTMSLATAMKLCLMKDEAKSLPEDMGLEEEQLSTSRDKPSTSRDKQSTSGDKPSTSGDKPSTSRDKLSTSQGRPRQKFTKKQRQKPSTKLVNTSKLQRNGKKENKSMLMDFEFVDTSDDEDLAVERKAQVGRKRQPSVEGKDSDIEDEPSAKMSKKGKAKLQRGQKSTRREVSPESKLSDSELSASDAESDIPPPKNNVRNSSFSSNPTSGIKKSAIAKIFQKSKQPASPKKKLPRGRPKKIKQARKQTESVVSLKKTIAKQTTTIAPVFERVKRSATARNIEPTRAAKTAKSSKEIDSDPNEGSITVPKSPSLKILVDNNVSRVSTRSQNISVTLSQNISATDGDLNESSKPSRKANKKPLKTVVETMDATATASQSSRQTDSSPRKNRSLKKRPDAEFQQPSTPLKSYLLQSGLDVQIKEVEESVKSFQTFSSQSYPSDDVDLEQHEKLYNVNLPDKMPDPWGRGKMTSNLGITRLPAPKIATLKKAAVVKPAAGTKIPLPNRLAGKKAAPESRAKKTD